MIAGAFTGFLSWLIMFPVDSIKSIS